MRKYFHPKEGVYYKRKTFEKDYALMGAGGGGAVGALSGHSIEGETDGLTAGLGLAGSLVSGLIGGYKMPRKIKSWWNPPPKRAPKRYPRRIPPRVVPSRIGDRGLVANWLFYNGAGDTLYDYSGKGNHGNINGAKWTDKEQAGWALDFDGVDDYVDCGNDASLDNFTALTLTAWVNGQQQTNLVWFSGGTYSNEIILHFQGAGFYLVASDGTASGYLDWDSNPPLNEWVHLAATWDGSTMKLYQNGVPQATTLAFSGGSEGKLTNSTRRYIGHRFNSANPWFKGLIDEVRIYNRALSEDEIKKIYEDEKAMFK